MPNIRHARIRNSPCPISIAIKYSYHQDGQQQLTNTITINTTILTTVTLPLLQMLLRTNMISAQYTSLSNDLTSIFPGEPGAWGQEAVHLASR